MPIAHNIQTHINSVTQTNYFNNRRETLKFDFDKAQSHPEDPYAGYELTRTYQNNDEDTLTGYRALASARDQNGLTMDKSNPMLAEFASAGRNDPKTSFPYQLGRAFARSNTSNPGIFGQTFDSPLTSTLAGGAIGLGAGALIGWAGNKLNFDTDPTRSGVLGALGGLGLGYLAGHFADKNRQRGLQKSGSMYQDPRNFILEKLQKANDISMVDKAMLASKVRNMSTFEAKSLEASVRSALGIGVGAIIAKYFGLSPAGMLASMFGGAIAMNATGFGGSFGNNFVKAPTASFFGNSAGFKTYNDFFNRNSF